MTYNKFRAKKTTVDGITFDSKKEANRYCELKLLLKANEIKDLELQPKFVLQDKFKKNGKTHRAISYVADFRYIDCTTGETVVEDVKGMETKVFKIKKKLFEYKYSNLTLKIV
ncbi:MAG: DUF1064 domain-containing protein [Firmicutes bacterium]|nr:DUF1064 domain-containing protein [Bacillota bacterium]